uniref:Reverse transcriptase domain-containing protein n=1 Tax=Musa acuminata subsp. malaccensis TaxID=214687 RepID=A0A804L6Q4_MUSAM|nr:PREDICTED: uncharacterized protein LOC103971335 [Musa acuminata subsp. malaccensis]
MQAFLMGLRPSRFFWSLIEKPPMTIPEMFQRANQYIAAEALMAGRHKDSKRPRMEQARGTTSAAPRGHLGHYLKELREASLHPKGPVEKQIDVIIGGPAADGSSSTTRKAYTHGMVEKHPRLESDPEITFKTEEGECSHRDDAMVISIRIANAWVKRVLVDTRSSANVLYLDAFKKLSLTNEDLIPIASGLTKFTEDSISPLGTTILPVTIGEEPRAKTTMTTFMVVNLPSTYNVILSRLTLNKLKVVVSTYYQAIKFLTSIGVKESRSNPGESRRCYLIAVTLPEKSCPHQALDPREEARTPMHLEPPEQLTESSKDMPKINSGVTKHHLNIHPEARPVKQKPRKFAPRLTEVLVKKHNESWRMCVNYTDLNRACPKDCYPLPRVNQLVDATAGYELLTFMDSFLGYNQIRMALQDQEHIAFITDRGVYCYKVMLFGLKNTGGTYQRIVNELFKQQLRRNMEVYVDNMIVKSKSASTHMADLAETFRTLKRFGMRLNPSKCVFGVRSGKFFRFIIHQRGIDANPKKVRAIIEMQPPRSIKEVQRLTGRLITLSRFNSRSRDKYLPFFRVLRQTDTFTWN